jgi:hypothetical protein
MGSKSTGSRPPRLARRASRKAPRELAPRCAIAESISELMNCGAFGFVVALIAGALWAIARWRIRRLEANAG